MSLAVASVFSIGRDSIAVYYDPRKHIEGRAILSYHDCDRQGPRERFASSTGRSVPDSGLCGNAGYLSDWTAPQR